VVHNILLLKSRDFQESHQTSRFKFQPNSLGNKIPTPDQENHNKASGYVPRSQKVKKNSNPKIWVLNQYYAGNGETDIMGVEQESLKLN